MLMQKKIQVTLTDIKKGKPQAAWYCPISRAVKRTLRIKMVCVGRDVIEFRYKDQEIVAAANVKVQNFIHRFDSGMPVKPFSFILKGY